jgi:hypothetical protein
MEMSHIRGPLLRGRKSGYSPVKMTNLWLCDDPFPMENRLPLRNKTTLCVQRWWQTRLPVLWHVLRRLSIAISLFQGKPASILSRRTSYRRRLQASILTNLVTPVPSVMITVSRLAMRDPSAKCADSPRDVQSPFQLPILGPVRLHLCPA